MFPLSLFVPFLLPFSYLCLELPFWVSFCGISFIIWRLVGDFFKLGLPSKKVTGILSAIGLVMIIVGFETLVGRDAAGSFLFLLAGLKILEYRTQEESPFLILLGLFLCCTVFLFSLNLFWSLGLGASILALAYQLIPLNVRKNTPTTAVNIFTKTVVTALPLTFLLFFFFPRFTNLFQKFGGSRLSKIAQSGSSDRLDPGAFSEVRENKKLVFQAEFLLGKKNTRDLYWRGDVFTTPTGFSWKKADVSKNSQIPLTESAPAHHSTPDYRILLAPQESLEFASSMENQENLQKENQARIFTLDETDTVHSHFAQITMQPDRTFRVSPAPDKTLEYFGTIEYKTPKEKSAEEYLTLPPKFPDRVKSLVASWNLKGLSPEQKLEKILFFFQKEKFHYSLRPGHGGQMNLEKFLFEIKEGFCEHYASSLALLLRANQVPARVVGGYHGGTFNEYGKFWMIREKDAHAWVEYINSKGRWTRADATNIVAPLRLEIGAEEYFALPVELQILKDLSDSINNFRQKKSFLLTFRFWLEGLNYRWTSWLLNFDLAKQKEILKDLQGKLPVSLLITFAFLILLGLAVHIHQLRIQKNESLEDKYLNQILSWKEFEGIGSQRSLGPREMLNLVTTRLLLKHQEVLSQSLSQFFETYMQIAYGSQFELRPLLKSQFKTLRKLHRKL